MNAALFGDLFQFIRNGMSVKQDKSGDGLPISRIETISDGLVNPEKVGFAGLTDEAAKGWMLEPGDILFSHINSVDHVGKCAVYRGIPGKLVHGMNLLNLRCDQSKLFHEFAKYLIRSPGFRGRLANFINKAVNQASVSIGNLRTIPVSIPSLPEQRRIAAILDKAEALRAQRRQTLIELDRLAQAVFVEMFGHPATNSLNLPVVSLGSLGNWSSGGTPPRGIDGYFTGSIPWFSSGELEPMYVSKSAEYISERAIRETSAKRVPAGSVMLGMYDTAALKASIAAVDCSCNQAIAFGQLDPSLAEATYVYSAIVIGRDHFRRLQRGVRQKNLNLSMIRDIKIPTPPILRQREFTDRLHAIESLKAIYNTALAESDALFASLQDRAFTGVL